MVFLIFLPLVIVGFMLYSCGVFSKIKKWNNKMGESLKIWLKWIGIALIVAPFIWDGLFSFMDGYWLMDIIITIAGLFFIVATYQAGPFGIIGLIMIAMGWLSIILYITGAHRALTFSALLLVFGGIAPDLPKIICKFKKRKSVPLETAKDCELPLKQDTQVAVPSEVVHDCEQDAQQEQLEKFVVTAVRATVSGTVIQLTVTNGQIVGKGDEILVIDNDDNGIAHPVNAPYAGVISLQVAIAKYVRRGDVVALIKPDRAKGGAQRSEYRPKTNNAKAKNIRDKSKTAQKVIGKVPLLIDGNNVVRDSRRHGWRVLKTLLDWLNANNVDYFLYFDATIRHLRKEKMDAAGNAFIDAQLQDERRVTVCPARDEADKFILSCANKEGNHIISNDGYKKWEDQYPWIRATNETGNRRVHKFSVEGDVLSVPDLDIRETIEELHLSEEIYAGANKTEQGEELRNLVWQSSDCRVAKALASDKTKMDELRKKAAQGNPEAQYYLGLYNTTSGGDLRRAEELLNKAATQGYIKARNALGFVQGFLGLCAESDYNLEEAMKWYRKAAEQGDANAKFSLGLCYANGDGVDKDAAEAVKWYRKAAEQGHKEAAEMLKGMHFKN